MKKTKNSILKNIQKKFGWSLNEYAFRRNLDADVVRNVVYGRSGKQFRGKAVEAIKIMSQDGVYVHQIKKAA